MPPGFMKATTALPKSESEVDASCASAITSPKGDSWLAPEATVPVPRTMSAVMEPTGQGEVAVELGGLVAVTELGSTSARSKLRSVTKD